MNTHPHYRLYYSKAGYWNEVETLRTDGGLPSWAFNFISVHRLSNGKYSLVLPLKFKEWKEKLAYVYERFPHDSLHDATNFALRLTQRYPRYASHVVQCCDHFDTAKF